MFNLLPEALKREIKSEYRKRWLVAVLTLLLFIQVSFLVFLLPSWTLSFSKEKEAVLLLEELGEGNTSQGAGSTASIITETNLKLRIIDTVMKSPEAFPLIDAVISNRNTSIKLSDISYTSMGTSTATVTLSGVGATRDALVSFSKKLEETKLFKSVNLPVGNLAKDKDINFSINITVVKNDKK